MSDDVEFVVVGVRRAGGVSLFASTEVSNSRFVRETDGWDSVPLTANPKGPAAKIPRVAYLVGLKMTTFDQILGDTYLEALRTLLEEWARKGDMSPLVGYPEPEEEASEQPQP